MSDDVKELTIEEHLHNLLVGCVLKEKAIAAAKKALPDNFSRQLTVNARIQATVTKGASTPGSSGERPASLDPSRLCLIPIVAEVLRRLKVTPGQLRRALKAVCQPGKPSPIDDLAKQNSKLQAVFTEIADAIAAELPPVKWSSGGREGAVNVIGTCTITDAIE